MTENNKPSKLQFRIDIILSVLFIIMFFFFGIMTVITKWGEINGHARKMKYLKPYLEDTENYSTWDMLAARVRSVDAYLAGNLYGASELGYVNSSMQYAMGKRMITTGTQNMIKLNSGHLYDLQNYVPMDSAADSIVALKESIPADTQFLFVYEHPTIYRADQMPEGYDVLDHSAEIADEITSKLRDRGIEVMDSREVLNATGMELSEFLYRTDQHWSTRAAITMAQAISQNLGLDYKKLDIDRFDTETYEKLFMGKYGQRIGTPNIDPDDVTIYWPKYPTQIHRYTDYLGEITDISGSFKESMIRWKYLQPDKGKTWNKSAYYDYGLVENIDIFTNANGPDYTILLLKDSYSAPIGSFLSLTAGKVIAADMRRYDHTVEELIEEYHPDAVVVAYSMQMLRDDEYEFQ